jgi:hypothetical protein
MMEKTHALKHAAASTLILARQILSFLTLIRILQFPRSQLQLQALVFSAPIKNVLKVAPKNPCESMKRSSRVTIPPTLLFLSKSRNNLISSQDQETSDRGSPSWRHCAS